MSTLQSQTQHVSEHALSAPTLVTPAKKRKSSKLLPILATCKGEVAKHRHIGGLPTAASNTSLLPHALSHASPLQSKLQAGSYR